ncbi:hypothetical protein BDV26DRAFT_274685 [Aspergillus bertholletiae]|uniref:Uncharacterized protein n=1 Tax=Aspergillus bertholletiae TaxID=1226010 RepID=A0A5N7ATC7_9EURO|nr:hypothetical protein BDV26DRAFT_274685 [Aspergillus bertholletiae]
MGREKLSSIKGLSVCDKFIYLKLCLCNRTKLHRLISMLFLSMNWLGGYKIFFSGILSNFLIRVDPEEAPWRYRSAGFDLGNSP